MNLLLAIGAAALFLGLSQRKVAQAGGNTSAAKRRAALRRLPPHLRAKALSKASTPKGGAAGISRGVPGGFHAMSRRAPVHAPPLPWLPEDVDAEIFAELDAGERNIDALTLRTLRAVYPVTDDGRLISWPALPEDSAGIRALEERVRARALRHLGALADLEAEEHYHG